MSTNVATATAVLAPTTRNPSVYVCAMVRTCVERATTTGHLPHHVVVWACATHGDPVSAVTP